MKFVVICIGYYKKYMSCIPSKKKKNQRNLVLTNCLAEHTERGDDAARLKLDCVREKIKERCANLVTFYGSLKIIYFRVGGRANISSLSNISICFTVCARVQKSKKTHDRFFSIFHLRSLTSCRVTSMFQMTMPPSELQEMS